MTRDDQLRWDRKHRAGPDDAGPSPFVAEIFECGAWDIPTGHALDIATGKGRHAVYLAERGFAVEGIDISEAALSVARRRGRVKSLTLSWQRADLEGIELPEARYRLIVNINYLQRSLVPQIRRALTAGGFVIFETYLAGQEALGHPKSPAYLLRHNELLEIFSGLRVLLYREGRFDEGGAPAFRAGLFAQKPD